VRTPNQIWRLFPTQIAVLLIILALASWYGARALRDFELTERLEGQEALTLLLQPGIAEKLQNHEYREPGDICRQPGLPVAAAIVVVDADSRLLCSSGSDRNNRDNLRDDPEIEASLSGRVSTASRFNGVIGEEMLYVAVPLPAANGEPLGALRTAVPASSPSGAVARLHRRIGLGLLLAVATLALLTFISTRRISRALAEITASVQRYGEGDLQRLITVSGPAEVVRLAQGVNRMIDKLNQRLRSEASRRNELETVVSSMVEGVIAFDHDASSTFPGWRPRAAISWKWSATSTCYASSRRP
jgi:two-component system phosphate regulon sensor histidine kinase PhoR